MTKEFDVVQWVEEQERQRLLRNPPPPRPESERPTVHWTELTALPPGSRIATEWNFYRQQVVRFLAEGHEGRWVLIKGEQVIGIWDSEREANEVCAQRFPMQDALIHQVLTREPVLRGPTFNRLCPS